MSSKILLKEDDLLDILETPVVYARTLVRCDAQADGLKATLEDTAGNAFTLEVAAVRDDVLRLRVYEGAFDVPEYDFVRDDYFAGCHMDIREEDNRVILTTDAVTLTLERNPFRFVLKNLSGHILYEEQFLDANAVGPGLRRVPPMGFALSEDGEKTAVNINVRLRYDEHIFGLGERFGEFDKRGQSVHMWNFDTLGCRDDKAYKNIPFYVSSKGYGLLVNSHLDTVFHIGSVSNASLHISAPGRSLEYFLLAGEPRHVVGTMTHMTGPAALPPDWSFGLWYSNGFFEGMGGAEALQKDALTFRSLGVPCDVMHLDCFWLRDDMWCDFVWDEATWPDHAAMLKSFRDESYRICLWINPYVTCRTDMFREGSERGFFVKTKEGEPYLADLWHGLLSLCAILDITNADAVAWFKEKLRATLREGVHVLKTDFGEDIPVDCVFANGRTGQYMRNVYATLYNQIVYSVVAEFEGTGLVWGRSGGAGMQKTPVCWSGDPRSCYEGMAATLRGGLSLGVSGVPFWSHDIGGFYGDVDEEVYVRWAQFGLFSSHSRLHGTSARQPWAYTERIKNIVCDTIKLRYKIMPYILKTAEKCVREGLPFIRPLWLMNPDDPAALSVWDEYYFGDDFIVAPVFGGDGAQRAVYLPEGTWKNWFTGALLEGGRYHTLCCPLENMLLFVRSEAVIPQYDTLPQHMG